MVNLFSLGGLATNPSAIPRPTTTGDIVGNEHEPPQHGEVCQHLEPQLVSQSE